MSLNEFNRFAHILLGRPEGKGQAALPPWERGRFKAAGPQEEPRAGPLPPRERESFVKKWIAERYDDFGLGDRLDLRWPADFSRCCVKDPNGHILCKFGWREGTPSAAPLVCEYATPFSVTQKNARFPYSCGIGERDNGSGGSMSEKLGRERDAVGGLMSTN